MSLSFRPAEVGDVAAIVALVESAYRGESSRAGWTTEADILDGQRTDPQGVLEVVQDRQSVLLLAFSFGGTLTACCHLERHDDYAYFGMFAVQPTLQGGGVGKAVLAEAERLAVKRWGISEMHMTVISVREELIAWYERRGYRRTGRMSPFPYGDERFGLPKRDDLEFELLVKALT
ncbi:MAG TPA: GNAT family N-acetyltransferase [Candidatus Limnocylindrales bacterium]|nr:GNAT family N-acetyltransferase [Candidatus Limnocylindrales bacterium]